MFKLDTKRICVLAASVVTAVACVAIALVGSASASATARAASHVAYVSDYQSRDYCDDWNDVTWDDCNQDWGDDWGDPPDPGPSAPTGPTGPTGPTAPPITYWPKPPHGAVAKLRANGRTA